MTQQQYEQLAVEMFIQTAIPLRVIDSLAFEVFW